MTQDIEAIRRLLEGDDVSDIGREAGWARVAVRSRARRRRSWTRRAAATVAVAAAALGLMTAGRGPEGLPATASAATYLLKAADELRDDRPLAPGEIRVIRTDMSQLGYELDEGGRWHVYVLPRSWEQRAGADGSSGFVEHPDGSPEFANRRAERAYEEAVGPYKPVAPKPPVFNQSGPDTRNPDWAGLSAREILSLPTDAERLAARLRRRIASQPSEGPPTVNYVAIRLLTFGPTPPRVRAALAELLAHVRGVTVVGDERVGRRAGVTLQFPRGRGANYLSQIVLDKGTGELLAQRTLLAAADPAIPGSRAGTVLDVQTYRSKIVRSLSEPVRFGPPPAVSGPKPAPTA